MANEPDLRYFYQINLKMVINDKTINIDRVLALSEQRDHLQNMFPIFTITFNLSSDDMLNLYNNQHMTYFIVERYVKKYKFTEDNPEGSPTVKPYSTKLDMAGVFIPFFDPKEFKEYINDNILKKGTSNDTGTTNPLSSTLHKMEATLYEAGGLKSNKCLINEVLVGNGENDGVEVGSALLHIINQCDAKKVIIDPPDNKNLYENIIMLPGNVRNSIHNLQARYGIYANGVSVFYDVDTLYILDKYKSNHEYEKDTKHKAIFNMYDFGKKPLATSKEIGDDTIQYDFQGIPVKENIDVLTGEVLGNKILIASFGRSHTSLIYDDGKLKGFEPPIDIIDRPNPSHKLTGNKISVEYDELNNPYNVAAVIRASSPNTIFNIPTIRGVLSETFKPNTDVVVKFPTNKEKDLQLSGNYSIIKCTLLYSRDDIMSDQMTCTAYNVTLAKI